jgi:hypothetical protein
MARPYPVPLRVSTIYTESRGNVDVSTVELRQFDGTVKFETCLFWDSDDNNPADIGSVVVEVTHIKEQAYRDHLNWCVTAGIEAKIHRELNRLKEK